GKSLLLQPPEWTDQYTDQWHGGCGSRPGFPPARRFLRGRRGIRLVVDWIAGAIAGRASEVFGFDGEIGETRGSQDGVRDGQRNNPSGPVATFASASAARAVFRDVDDPAARSDHLFDRSFVLLLVFDQKNR